MDDDNEVADYQVGSPAAVRPKRAAKKPSRRKVRVVRPAVRKAKKRPPNRSTKA